MTPKYIAVAIMCGTDVAIAAPSILNALTSSACLEEGREAASLKGSGNLFFQFGKKSFLSVNHYMCQRGDQKYTTVVITYLFGL